MSERPGLAAVRRRSLGRVAPVAVLEDLETLAFLAGGAARPGSEDLGATGFLAHFVVNELREVARESEAAFARDELAVIGPALLAVQGRAEDLDEPAFLRFPEGPDVAARAVAVGRAARAEVVDLHDLAAGRD